MVPFPTNESSPQTSQNIIGDVFFVIGFFHLFFRRRTAPDYICFFNTQAFLKFFGKFQGRLSGRAALQKKVVTRTVFFVAHSRQPNTIQITQEFQFFQCLRVRSVSELMQFDYGYCRYEILFTECFIRSGNFEIAARQKYG